VDSTAPNFSEFLGPKFILGPLFSRRRDHCVAAGGVGVTGVYADGGLRAVWYKTSLALV